MAFITTLRNEIDDQKGIMNDRRKQNADLASELDRQKATLDSRCIDIERVKRELAQQNDLSDDNRAKIQALEEELAQMRERNREDAQEIERLNLSNDAKGKESVDLAARIRALEYDISKSLARIDDLNRLIDAKSADLRAKEVTLLEAENELDKLKAHLDRLEKDLAY